MYRQPTDFCRFNPREIGCEDEQKNCDTCGWNPEVKRYRVLKLRRNIKALVKGVDDAICGTQTWGQLLK